jgi:hypothetical protein
MSEITKTSTTDITALTARAERLIDALAGSILSTAEVAAERVELAAKVAQVQQRMTAFAAVLEAVSAQKQALLGKVETATGAMRTLLQQQVEALTAQELAVLAKAGVPQPAAQQAIAAVDAGPEAGGGGKVYMREGRRFARIGGANGNGHAAKA